MAVVGAAGGQVIGRIPVPKGPHGLVMTPDGRKAYVSSDGDRTVSVIDAATDRVTATLDVEPNPHGLAISPDGRRILVRAWGSDEALVIDTATDRITVRVSVPRPHDGTLSVDGRTAWVGAQQQGDGRLPASITAHGRRALRPGGRAGTRRARHHRHGQARGRRHRAGRQDPALGDPELGWPVGPRRLPTGPAPGDPSSPAAS